MPSHALDDPTEARARRRAARRRRNLRDWRHGVLAVLLVASIAGVTGQPSFRGGATGLLAGLARMVLLDALFAVIMVAAAVLVIVCSEKLSAGRAGPAPRWQYLLGAVGWLAVAACFALAGRDTGPSWLARACVALCVWSTAAGLVLLGRAAFWGRARMMFWWWPPPWAAPGPPASPTEPA